jgi:hypothetical protein
MIERAAAAAKLGIKAHAHMLRHERGYKLANDGIDTPGAAGLPRASQYPEYDPVHGTRVGSVQGILARLAPCRRKNRCACPSWVLHWSKRKPVRRAKCECP